MKGKRKFKEQAFLLVLAAVFSLLLVSQVPAYADTSPGSGWPFIVEKAQQDGSLISNYGESSDASDKIQKSQKLEIKPKAEPPEHFSIKYREQFFSFKDNPILTNNGEIYICAVDPDFGKMFDTMGITHSWFNFSQRLFLHHSGKTVNWFVNQGTAKIGEQEVSIPVIARSEKGKPYIPLRTIAGLLDFKLTPGNNFVAVQPAVSITSAIARNESTIDFIVSSPSRIDYNVSYTSRPPTVRLSISDAGYISQLKNFSLEGVKFSVTDTVEQDNLSILLEFPEHWKGIVVPSGHRNQVVIRMKPNLVFAWGTKEEVLTSIEPSADDGRLSLNFKTTNPVQYYWSFSPDERKLFVDFPFVLKGHRIDSLNFRSPYVKNYRVTTYKPDNVSITRVEFELADNTSFKICEPDIREPRTFALLIGPAYLLPDASPYQGSAGTPAYFGNRIIVIDPGHGGSDPGAVYNGIREKDLTLCIAKSLAAQLTQRGWKVILTRDTDRDVSFPGSKAATELQARVDVAHRHNAALFISIHCNASLNRSARGTSIHWFKPEDRSFALALRDALGANIGTTNRGISKDQFYVLSRTRVPAVLVEAAFMSNSADLRILSCINNRQKIAGHLARSIDLFMNSPNMASAPVRSSGSGE
jgi:N-acetylmuramoyl-L-alanine amidase